MCVCVDFNFNTISHIHHFVRLILFIYVSLCTDEIRMELHEMKPKRSEKMNERGNHSIKLESPYLKFSISKWTLRFRVHTRKWTVFLSVRYPFNDDEQQHQSWIILIIVKVIQGKCRCLLIAKTVFQPHHMHASCFIFYFWSSFVQRTASFAAQANVIFSCKCARFYWN